MGTTTIETLQVQLKADVDDLRKQMDAARKSLGQLELGSKETREELEKLSKAGTSLQSSFGGLKSLFAGLGTAYIGKKLIDIGKSSVQMAMDVVESESLFETSMGSMAGAAREWSEQLSESLGLNAYELRQNVGVMYNMTKSMGIAGDTAYDLSTSLVLLAQDMASFYNMDTEEAFVKLRAGITGETEPLKALGILVDENTVSQYAYQNGLAETGEELTQQQKVLARYYAILDQTSTAQGDLARTIESPANQLRIFQAQLEQTRIELGMGLLPVLQEVMPYMIALAQKLTEIIGALFGVEKAANAVSSSLGGADYSSISQATESENELGDAIEETDKKLKKSLTGFDEINKLSAGSESLADQMGLTGEDLSFDIPTLGDGMELKSLWDTNALNNARETIDGIFEVVGNLSGALIPIIGIKAVNGISNLTRSLGKLSTPMSKISKGLIGAGGVVVGFKSTQTAGKELAKILSGDSYSLGTMAWSLVTGTAGSVAAGLAIGGPLGALAGGLSFVGGAIYGVIKEFDDMRSELANNAFIQDTGLVLSDLADAYVGAWQEAETLGAKTEESRKIIEESTDLIGESSQNLQPYLDKIMESGSVTEEETTAMEKDLDAMVEGMQKIVDTRVDNIFDTFNSFVALARENFNAELSAMQAKFMEFQALFGKVTGEYRAKISVLLDKAAGEGLDEKEREELNDAIDRLTNLSLTVTAEESSFDDFVAASKEGLSVESVEDAQRILNDLAVKTDAYQKSMTEAYENAVADIKTLEAQNAYLLEIGDITKSQHDYFSDVFSDAKEELEASYDASYSKMQDDVKTVTDMIQAAALRNLSNISDELRGEYNSMNWAQKRWYKSAESFARRGLRDAKDDSLKPIEDAIQNYLDAAGIAADTWLTSAAEQAINEHIKIIPNYDNDIADTEIKNMDEVISEILQGLPDIADYASGFSIGALSGYATGGFPEDGLFYANSQELVGRFSNGRTAVANNLQILEGIKQAVLEALQTAGGMDGGNWTIQVVDTDGNIKAEQIISAAERRNRRDGRTILPLGD